MATGDTHSYAGSKDGGGDGDGVRMGPWEGSWDNDWDDRVWDDLAETIGTGFPARDVAKLLLTYLPPLLLVMATVGNILTAILMWRLHRRVLSTCLYVFVTEIVDLCALYIRCGNDWLRALAQVDVQYVAMHSNNSVCKIFPFVSDLALHLSTWMVVAMATETAVITLRPQRLMRLCRVERARAVILLLVVLLICVNAHCFWTYALIKTERAGQTIIACTTSRLGNQHSEQFRKVAWPVIDILVADFFPLFIIFSSLVIVLTKRVKRKEHLRQLENGWKAYSVDAKTARQLQSGFLGVAFCHLLLLLPKLGFEVYSFLVEPGHLFLFQYSIQGDVRRILARTVCYLLLYVYLSCKFFVFLATCRQFRTGVWTLLTCTSCGGGGGGVGGGGGGGGGGAASGYGVGTGGHPRSLGPAAHRTACPPPPITQLPDLPLPDLPPSSTKLNDYRECGDLRDPLHEPSPHHVPLLPTSVDNVAHNTGEFEPYPTDNNVSPRRAFSTTAV